MTHPHEVFVQTTEVEVSVLPEGDINRLVFTITVAYRGDDQWAVIRHGECLGSDGNWDYELRPSEREDEWLATHRFDFQTALKLATDAAPGIRCNGETAVDAWRRTHPTP
ncbi:hypothetical protein SMD44_00975 [Streptomyces alboflavus]|uniref:Uncharacterized protein n=1 Tax=Streptomyces alboflavus TaxID=67267 RepID=A0A1Z1W597_9ACTN|nr:hypothetical protein [Streptomyces alboflavus]ARX81577.1 hypothetical protein SMD44_00975 [Streptomyces alboflavus]